MLPAGQISNVASTQAFFTRVGEKGYVKTADEQRILDAFSRQGVTKGDDATEASFTKVTETLGVSAQQLRKVMGGCPFAGGLPKAQARAE